MDIALQEIFLKIEIVGGKERIVVSPVNGPILEKLVRQVDGARYLKWGSWHIPCNRSSYEQLKNLAGNRYRLNCDLLREQLKAREISVPVRTAISLPTILIPENIDALDVFIKTLKLKAYSESTIKIYRTEFMKLLLLLKDRRVDSLEPHHIKSYMLWLITKKGYGESLEVFGWIANNKIVVLVIYALILTASLKYYNQNRTLACIEHFQNKSISERRAWAVITGTLPIILVALIFLVLWLRHPI